MDGTRENHLGRNKRGREKHEAGKTFMGKKKGVMDRRDARGPSPRKRVERRTESAGG
jgi:hypothetical protein